jgi:hypothetical protein
VKQSSTRRGEPDRTQGTMELPSRHEHVPLRSGSPSANAFRIDHTTHIYPMDPSGQVAALLYFGDAPETIAAKVSEAITRAELDKKG